MIALAAAALVIAATAHPGYGDGTCVDVTINGTRVADTLCPTPDPLGVRTIAAHGSTVYFGVSKKPVTLTFAKRTVTAKPGPDGAYAVAVKGDPTLGAIASGADQRDVDIFGLPAKGKTLTLASVRDEHNRHVRLRVGAPHVLVGSRRRYTLCTGIQIGAFSPGRTLCHPKANQFQARFSADCKHHRELVYGIAPPRIVTATVVRSDGRESPISVSPVPDSVKRPGAVFFARLTGSALATKVRGYDATGTLLATASLGAGCSG